MVIGSSETVLKDKPKQIKRLSIETLINDSEEEKLLEPALSSQCKPDQHCVNSNTSVVTSPMSDIHILILKEQSISFLKGIRVTMQSPQGFHYGCSIISKWLKGVYYPIDNKLLDVLVELIDVG